MAEQAKGPLQATIVAHDVGGIGGMERQLTELITGALRAGSEVVVVSRTCDLPTHPKMRWVRVPGPARPFAIAYPWFLVLGSILVRLRGRGVVHATGAILLMRTTLCTVHYCHRAAAELERFSRASREGLAYRLNAVVAAWMSRAGEAWCYSPRRTERLVGVSAGVASELRRYFPKMRARIGMIPNGVDTDHFRPNEDRNPASDPINAIFVGSEWERKGLGVAIDALASAPGVDLTVVGTGDETAYADRAAGQGVADRVHFVGRTDDVADHFSAADVFLMPTAYETFSLVSYEAAACGLPLIATRVNGVVDLLRDGENGWFVERDSRDVAEKLRAMRENAALRQTMGERARRDSLAFSWERVVKAYLELYAELARGS